MAKFLITGAYGFVGKYLSEYIDSQNNTVIKTGIQKDSKVILDVCNKINCEEVIIKYKPTHIIHLAGFSSVKKSFDNPELCEQINVYGTKNILDTINKYSKNTKVIIVSSSEVYGKPKYLPVDEKHPLNGNNPYALSRIKQEELVLKNYPNLNMVIARSFNHTGPGQQIGFMLPDFASQVANIVKRKAKPEIKVGNLNVERDFSDVRDVVKAYYLLSILDTKDKIYNICSGKYISIQEILNKLIEYSKIEINNVVDKDKLRQFDVKRYYGSNEKIKKELNWNPSIPIEVTIKETLEFWLNRTK